MRLHNSVFPEVRILILLVFLFAAMPSLLADAGPGEQLKAVAHIAEEGEHAAEAKDAATAKHEYEELHELWEGFEDAVRESNATAYVAMEGKLHAVRDLLKVEPLDFAALATAFGALEHESLASAEAMGAVKAAAPGLAEQLKAVAHIAEEGEHAAEAKDAATAKHEYEELHELWEGFEDAVREANASAYVAMEGKLHAVRDLLKVEPLDFAALTTAFAALEHESLASAAAMGAAKAASPGLAQQLKAVAHIAEEGEHAAEAKDAATAKHEYEELHELWESFEDAVREANASAYVAMEGKLHAVRDLLKVEPLDFAALATAFGALEHKSLETAESMGAVKPTASGKSGDEKASVAGFVALLDALKVSIAAKSTEESRAALEAAVSMWPAIEGHVKVADAKAYDDIETGLGKSLDALRANPPRFDEAMLAVDAVRASAAPHVDGHNYGIKDAFIILFREGLEALLVLVALLTFLKRSNNGDKQKWIWAGAGAGLLLSIGVGVVLHRIVNQIAAGTNRELLEGITGLVAAVMLFYVSYWLHSMSSFHSWQKYMNDKTTNALKKGSVFGLASLAFLAVFREGAETVVMYLGIAPSISGQSLAIGLVAAVAVLLLVAILVLVIGVRLPIRQFFMASGLLVYYLGFCFVGHGINALQVAGYLPPWTVPHLPKIPAIGLYPNGLAVALQVTLIIAAIAIALHLRGRDKAARISAGPAAR